MTASTVLGHSIGFCLCVVNHYELASHLQPWQPRGLADLFHLTLVTRQVVVQQTVRRVRIVYTSTLPIQLIASQSLDKLTLVVISGGFESRVSFHTDTLEDGAGVARY